MKTKLLTAQGFVSLASLPTFCLIRRDLIAEKQAVPVGDQYFSKDNVYHYAWDTEHNFYIVFKRIAREAQSIDFEFDCLPRQLLNSGRSLIL